MKTFLSIIAVLCYLSFLISFAGGTTLQVAGAVYLLTAVVATMGARLMPSPDRRPRCTCERVAGTDGVCRVHGAVL